MKNLLGGGGRSKSFAVSLGFIFLFIGLRFGAVIGVIVYSFILRVKLMVSFDLFILWGFGWYDVYERVL